MGDDLERLPRKNQSDKIAEFVPDPGNREIAAGADDDEDTAAKGAAAAQCVGGQAAAAAPKEKRAGENCGRDGSTREEAATRTTKGDGRPRRSSRARNGAGQEEATATNICKTQI